MYIYIYISIHTYIYAYMYIYTVCMYTVYVIYVWIYLEPVRETGAVHEALTGGKASENAGCREAQVVWRFRLTIDSTRHPMDGFLLFR